MRHAWELPGNPLGEVGMEDRVARATTVAFVSPPSRFFAQPASADDPITAALKRKEELERAVQISRANAERYQAVANQFQAVVIRPTRGSLTSPTTGERAV